MGKVNSKRIIVRIRGGLGNQLFSYSAARSLALRNNAELIIDNVTGFSRDKEYKRKYALNHFNIDSRLADQKERLEPFERYRRAIFKFFSRLLPYEKRFYLEQEYTDFDERLIKLKIKDALYLDGLWQSEKYFKDSEFIIRQDLVIKQPYDKKNLEFANRIISQKESVAIHIRWFSLPETKDSNANVDQNYYNEALIFIKPRFKNPHFFIFSDNPKEKLNLSLPTEDFTLVDHNFGEGHEYADLWLMSLCSNFIVANSTFSWWGAWLSSNPEKLVVAPKPSRFGINNSWRTEGLIPDEWILL